MNDHTLTEIAVAFFAVLGLFGFGVWTFVRAWLALDRRRYRLPESPPVPRWTEINASDFAGWNTQNGKTP